MVFKNIRLWKKPPQHFTLKFLSALLGIFYLVRCDSAWDVQPLVTAHLQTPSTPISRSTTIGVIPHDPFGHAILGLQKLYKATPRISIKQLEAEEYDGVKIPLPNQSFDSSIPRQYRILVHPSNFGVRFKKDLRGHSIHNKLLIVLHETTSQTAGAVNEMLMPHAKDQDQVSYHTIVRQDGTIVYLVDPIKRAYGAGDSIFKSSKGSETVQTKKSLAPSVNNFSYHISLETPPSGYHNDLQHSGYSYDQYRSLAWLIAHSGVESNRITTHAAIDQSDQRQDPRSFDLVGLHTNLIVQSMLLISPSLEPSIARKAILRLDRFKSS
jgi:N-acetylmuramoyl-L-alanine amidase